MHNTPYCSNRDADIFVYGHKAFTPAVTDHTFKVLTCSHESASAFNTDLEILRDYIGVNISDKNLMYNEYSGFYWIWKNYNLKKYIGLNHYRRYYVNCSSLPSIDAILSKKKIILNEPVRLWLQEALPNGGRMLTNREWYAYWHNVEDFDLLGDIINQYYPQYSDGFKSMSEANYLYACSMFTMDKDTFVGYCEYVFDVLMKFRKERGFFKVEDCVNYVENNQDKYIKPGLDYYDVKMQSRIVGYVAERALGAFLMSGGSRSLENGAEVFKWTMAK